ncbi:MAG: phosphatase PAP2 family protein [Saprospiraceae bacterium]
MDTILQWDQALFQAMNQELQNSFFDLLLPIWRNKYTWIPAYILLIWFLLKQLGRKGGFIILAAVLTIAIADTLSSKVLKKSIQRLRPCKTELIKAEVHLLVPCGSGYSFPSSHATNHFALAVFLISLLGTQFSKIKVPLLLWASLIAIAQVYVGVHFPFDVLVGALLGSLVGLATARIFKLLWR